jgi:protein ImuB
MHWLALFFPDWPLQALFRGQAHAFPQAVVARQRVVALDATALAEGVRPGHGLADALALAPALVTRSRSIDAEHAAQRDAACCALRYTPRVVLDNDGLLLEVAGSIRLFGGMDALLRQLRTDLAGAGFHALSASAPTARAARWLALGAPGQCVSDLDALPRALAPLPLHAMEAGTHINTLLADSGLNRLAQVMALPRNALARRDAAALRLLLDQALGHRPDPRPDFEPPRSIDSRIELPVPRHDADVLLFAATRLFNTSCAQLAAAHAGIETCRIELEHEHHPPTVLMLRLGTPSRDPRRMILLAREHLVRIPLPEAVTALRLVAPEWTALNGHSTDLFGPHAPSPRQRQEACSQLVERLRARLGDGAVHALSVHADHRPECVARAAEPGGSQTGAAAFGRPLWLLASPQALQMQDGHPWRAGRLQLVSGPERIESGWWDSDDLNSPCPGDALRDYFVAIGAGHERLWIYREHAPPHRWYLHGLFA